jgi:hypothetical protein
MRVVKAMRVKFETYRDGDWLVAAAIVKFNKREEAPDYDCDEEHFMLSGLLAMVEEEVADLRDLCAV